MSPHPPVRSYFKPLPVKAAGRTISPITFDITSTAGLFSVALVVVEPLLNPEFPET